MGVLKKLRQKSIALNSACASRCGSLFGTFQGAVRVASGPQNGHGCDSCRQASMSSSLFFWQTANKLYLFCDAIDALKMSAVAAFTRPYDSNLFHEHA